jgi:hypothetical protein
VEGHSTTGIDLSAARRVNPIRYSGEDIVELFDVALLLTELRAAQAVLSP